MKVYLDNAATTPIDPQVLSVMMPFLTEHFGNPSSSHAFGRKTKTAIENSRRIIAKWLNCLPSEIFFTSGGTEADNLAVRVAVKDLGCTHLITSEIEHSAVIKTMQHTAEKQNLKLSLVKLQPNGHVDLKDLERLLSENAKSFVSLMHGNNEIGNILPLKEVGDLCKKYGAYFHSDTVQTMCHFPFNMQELNIHFATAASHKFHGPKGIGFLYVNRSVRFNAGIIGGGQERGMRGGTENLYGIVGMAKALDIAMHDVNEHKEYISGLKNYMAKQLRDLIPGVIFNGDSASENSLYTVLNVTFPPNPNSDMLLFLLDLEGIAASGGSACSSGASKGSHVLEAIHALKPGCASIRFSFSRMTTKEEINYALEKVKNLCLVNKVVYV
ncbi:MAG: cysteine desulfurase family protein [Flavobacteriales bacterium]|nr:cysteine desulfurase family protein [Flavobacteriales bacterium]